MYIFVDEKHIKFEKSKVRMAKKVIGGSKNVQMGAVIIAKKNLHSKH